MLQKVTSVPAVSTLDSITDLKETNFGQSLPEESLRLLHWFANRVNIDNNVVIWLTFDPDNHDYGSHYYGNSERLLHPPPQGQQYYTIGNVGQNEDGAKKLPDYVVKQIDNVRRNMARVIIRVSGRRIHQVYITQHYGTSDYRWTWYDPQKTFYITTDLLRQIRNLSVGNSSSDRSQAHLWNIDDSQLWEIRNTWGDLASLGLLLFIVNPKKYLRRYSNRAQPAPRRNTPPDVAVEMPENRQILTNAHASYNECIEFVRFCACFLIVIATIILISYFNR